MILDIARVIRYLYIDQLWFKLSPDYLIVKKSSCLVDRQWKSTATITFFVFQVGGSSIDKFWLGVRCHSLEKISDGQAKGVVREKKTNSFRSWAVDSPRLLFDDHTYGWRDLAKRTRRSLSFRSAGHRTRNFFVMQHQDPKTWGFRLGSATGGTWSYPNST